jgi:hypothetical protein
LDPNDPVFKFFLLGVNTEKTKYMFISHHQNAGDNHNLKIGNKYLENVA